MEVNYGIKKHPSLFLQQCFSPSLSPDESLIKPKCFNVDIIIIYNFITFRILHFSIFFTYIHVHTHYFF